MTKTVSRLPPLIVRAAKPLPAAPPAPVAPVATGPVLSVTTMAEQEAGRRTLEAHAARMAGIPERFVTDVHGQDRGNPEPPKGALVPVNASHVPSFKVPGKAFEPRQD